MKVIELAPVVPRITGVAFKREGDYATDYGNENADETERRKVQVDILHM